MRITKKLTIRKGTKKGLGDVRGTQSELRILRKLQELQELPEFTRSQRVPPRITKTVNIRKGSKDGL